MAFQFVYGLAGAGKTQHCIDDLVATLQHEAFTGRLLLIVPEQASLQTERRLAAATEARGYAGAEVLSFTRLAEQALSESVIQPEILSRTARILALQTLSLQAESRWRHFRGATQWPGFFQQLDRMIESLLLEGVSPADLSNAADKIHDSTTLAKAKDIADIFEAYLDWLGPERLDPAQRQQQLVKHIENSHWVRQAQVWIDGFAFFDSQTQQTVITLARLARQVTLTLLCNPDALPSEQPRESDLFRRTLLTRGQLRSEIQAAGIEILPDVSLSNNPLSRYSKAPALLHLEQVWRSQTLTKLDTRQGLRLVVADSTREELRAIARHIRTQVTHSQGALCYSDFAVIARDLNSRAAQIQEVFSDFEVPFFLDRRRPLAGHPMARLLQEIVNAIAKPSFVPSEVLDLLQCSLLSIPRDVREELVCEAALGSDANWDAPQSPFEQAQRRRRVSHEVRLAWTKLLAAVDPLVSFSRKQRVSAKRWAVALQQALAELGVDRTLETWIDEAYQAERWESAATHHSAWNATMGLLEEFHSIIGERQLSAGELRQVLRLALAERSFAIAPPKLDQVLVAAIDRSRHPEVRHVWVLGMNEGQFPIPPPEDTLLDTLERNTLGEQGLRAPQPSDQKALDERLLAYIAFTRPSESLTLSYAYQGPDGSALEPSPYIEELQTLIPDIAATQAVERALPVTLHDAARLAQGHDEFGIAIHQGLTRSALFSEEYEYLARGRHYTNKTLAVAAYQTPSIEAGSVWHTSVSELQNYLNCPFQHFAKHGLKLEVPATGSFFEARAIGELTHRILAEVITEISDRDGRVWEVPDADWLQVLKNSCEKQLGPPEAAWRQRLPQQAFYADVLAQRLEDVILAQAARYRLGQFEPIGTEIAFGEESCGWPAPSVQCQAGRVTLRGRIDRIDAAAVDGGHSFLISDYKAQWSILRPEPLLHEALQLVLYAQAVNKRHPEWSWAGVQIIPYKPKLDMLARKYVQNASRGLQTAYLYRPRGWILEPEVALLDSELGANESITMSLKLTKAGRLQQRSDSRSEQQFEDVRRTGIALVQLASDGVVSGDVRIRPLVHQRTLACQRCDFRAVCRFDRRFNDPFASELLLVAEQGAKKGTS